jgi:hypothetical protein
MIPVVHRRVGAYFGGDVLVHLDDVVQARRKPRLSV